MFVENQNPQEDEDQNKGAQVNNPTVGAGGGAASASGGTTTPTTGNFSTIAPVAAQQPVQNWATAQDYLKANQSQAGDLGQKVESSLTNTLGTEKGTIDTSASQAKSDIAAGSTPYNEVLVNEAVKTPTSVANDPGKLQSFLSQWNAAYTGPSTFETSTAYNPAAQAVNEAKTKAGQLTSTGGREQLIGDQFNVYGAGNKGLDQAILQQAPQYENIQNLAPQFTGLQDYLTQQAANVNATVDPAKAAATNTATQTQNALKQASADFEKSLSDRLAAANTEYSKGNNLYQTIASQPDILASQAAQLGVNPTDLTKAANLESILQNQYGIQIDPSEFLALNAGVAPTNDTIATPEDFANAQALSKLNGSGLQSYLNQANATQAGTYKAPTVSYNTPGATAKYQELVNKQDTETLKNIPYDISKNIGYPSGLKAIGEFILSGGTNSPSSPQLGYDLKGIGLKTVQNSIDAMIRQGQLTPDQVGGYSPIGYTNPNIPIGGTVNTGFHI
jgi:hypothetical protein